MATTFRLPLPASPGRLALVGLIVGALVAAALSFAAFTGFFDRDPMRLLPGAGADRPEVAALFLSGDLGTRFGNGPHLMRALAAKGYPVLALSSPAAFGVHRSRAEVDAIVAQAIKDTLRRTGARKLVVVGQSFGADMLQTGLAALPPSERSEVAAVVLVVPGRNVFFRADPTGLGYRGRPDSDGEATARTLDWAPLACIYGEGETDSLCPALTGGNVKRIGLPGGHFLGRDYDRVAATVLDALNGMLGKTA